MIKIWNDDFSNMKLEIKMDSYITNLKTTRDGMFYIGSKNGTICSFFYNKRKLKYLVRTHNTKIL